jgi:DNA-binding MarR family transcriptional regulator
MRLARVFTKMDRAAAEMLRCHGLTVAQFDALAQIGASEGITQQELADKLLVTKGNISQLIAKMEARGLLRRCPRGRSLELSLTERGRALAAEVVPLQEAFVAARFGQLSPDEQRALLRLLRTLDRSLA